MIFPHARSALVRLSDCIKIGLNSCALAAVAAVKIFEQHEASFSEVRLVVQRAQRGELAWSDAGAEAQRIHSEVPMQEAIRGGGWQSVLHSHALSTILTCCFCIESYANSFAHFLLDGDRFVPEDGGAKALLEQLVHPSERMSTKEKWEALGKVGGSAFDKGRAPFQHFVWLFNFRDDHVHDKPTNSVDRAQRRYNRHLPDPVAGMLDLGHALFAADVYWNLIEEAHRLSRVPREQFHRHYNLQPWQDSAHQQALRELANAYRRKGLSPS